uniref:Immunity related GTPase M n=1 Tax=Mandrillus leucophaeus TaxID=9568 RepID=A0A2K5XKI3_MANLE
EATNVEKALVGGNLPEVASAIKETLKIVGMNTFIRHEGKPSPPTGLVKATQRCAPYLSSHFPNMVLWDLPGTGSATKTLENYLMEMQFNQYDFIMVASAQFSMNHVMLAKTIEDMGKKFYIVWTKLDMDLSTGALPEVQLLQIRENVLENLQKEQVCEH